MRRARLIARQAVIAFFAMTATAQAAPLSTERAAKVVNADLVADQLTIMMAVSFATDIDQIRTK